MALFQTIIQYLHTWPPEFILVVEYAMCCLTLMGMLYVFDKDGLYVYVVLAVVIANMQVLKTAQFNIFDFPVALGTLVFSSTFLAIDILTEFFDIKAARRAIWLGFSASLIVTLFMNLTLAFTPGATTISDGPSVHQAMEILFVPAPALLAASLISYLCSQYTDMWIFQTIRRLTAGKWLALRTVMAAMISALLDSILFSTLAWIVFAAQPISFDHLLYTYILGTYAFRLIVIFLQTPLMYGARLIIRHVRPASIHATLY